jgi:hypothetical protein
MPVLDVSDDRMASSSRADSESDFEEIQPGGPIQQSYFSQFSINLQVVVTRSKFCLLIILT